MSLIGSALQPAFADEGGVSYWIPGTFGSLAAVPGQPGWSYGAYNYYWNGSAGGDVALAHEFENGAVARTVVANFVGNLHADVDAIFAFGGYTFASPVLGGQAALSMGGGYGPTTASINGTLYITSPVAIAIPVHRSDSVTGFTDLYPLATLKWNEGVNNYMLYGAGTIPVGAYNSKRLANLGIGHAAVDGGAGYTYFDAKEGHEFSIVGGFTYNLENPSTDYQNGVDFHIDWAASQFLSKQFSLGVVGYLYDEIGCDSGSGDKVGCFQSRVVGLGPQATYLFPIGDMQGYLNLKGYWEFGSQHRPEGYDVWLTFGLSPAAQTAKASMK